MGRLVIRQYRQEPDSLSPIPIPAPRQKLDTDGSFAYHAKVVDIPEHPSPRTETQQAATVALSGADVVGDSPERPSPQIENQQTVAMNQKSTVSLPPAMGQSDMGAVDVVGSAVKLGLPMLVASVVFPVHADVL